jgi:hypothetical protein
MISDYSKKNLLFELNIEAIRELAELWHKTEKSRSNLIIPFYSDKKTRVSEQELRAACMFQLENLVARQYKVKYAIEVPTSSKYQFIGKSVHRSAETDLAIFENGNPICNIEFKAGQPSQQAVNKDMEKLFSENIMGNWSHLFRSQNSGTVKALMEKFVTSIEELKRKSISPKAPIIFTIGILSDRLFLSRYIDDLSEFDQPELIFDLPYKNLRAEHPSREKVNSWEVCTV